MTTVRSQLRPRSIFSSKLANAADLGLKLLLVVVLHGVPARAFAAELRAGALQLLPSQSRAPHPEPRVIVTVTSVVGPHDRDDVERAARGAWGRLVRCYTSSGRGAKGVIGIELRVDEDGQIRAARRVASTLQNPELSACVLDAIRRVDMPKASARSTVNADVYLAPGDRPLQTGFGP